MNNAHQSSTDSPTPLTCTRCGIATDHQFGGIVICEECYHSSGSCCPEFDPED